MHADAKKSAMPAWIPPMLATLEDKPFSHKEWLFEKKFDGVRCIVIRKGKNITLYSRNHRKMNAAYPELLTHFLRQKAQNFIIDGEIVANRGKLESFSILQPRMNLRSKEKARASKVKVAFYAFDLLYFEKYDLRSLPLIDRKKWLKASFQFSSKFLYSTHRLHKGLDFFKAVCKEGYEGVIAKKKSSLYTSKRSKNWLKFKGTRSQEFVIGGFTKPQGSRNFFGALLIGYYEKGKLRFAGKVGTGYDTKTLKSLGEKLLSIERKKSPFSESTVRGAHFVRPALVCQIGFTEWTKEGKLRHPRFLGLRKDKAAKSVKREGK